jgi:hypothetical protein
MGLMEWRNGGMTEWWDSGMAEWRDGGMSECYFTTYLIYPAIFMVHTDNTNEDANDDADNTNGF